MMFSLLAFLTVFTLIIVVHELGHYITARMAGIPIYEFSVGFPFSPRVITLFQYKETVFTVRLLPIGGFVGFSKDGSGDRPALFEVSKIKRAGIFSAGSLFNIVFAFIIFVPVFMIGEHLNLIDAIGLSVDTVWKVLSGTFVFIYDIFAGHGTIDGLSGPVGIAAVAGQQASKGLLSLLFFTGVLSMSLGIMNLLPLPATDGGHLVMLLIESVKKEPLSPKAYQLATVIGLALFFVLTIVVTYKDIARLVV